MTVAVGAPGVHWTDWSVGTAEVAMHEMIVAQVAHGLPVVVKAAWLDVVSDWLLAATVDSCRRSADCWVPVLPRWVGHGTFASLFSPWALTLAHGRRVSSAAWLVARHSLGELVMTLMQTPASPTRVHACQILV